MRAALRQVPAARRPEAVALPFAGEAFDKVVANHMPYLVTARLTR